MSKLASKKQPAAAGNAAGQIEHLPPGRHAELPADKLICPPGENARQVFAPGPLLALGNSLTDLGQLQEVVVCEEGKEYRVIAGERRVRAAIAAGMDLVQCLIYRGLTPLQKVRVSHAENFGRAEFNHVEKGREYKRYADLGLSVPQIAAETGDGDDTIRCHLALLTLPPAVREHVGNGAIPVKQAELICRVKTPAEQEHLAALVLSAGERDTIPEALAHPSGRGPWPVRALADAIAEEGGCLETAGWPLPREYAGRGPCDVCPNNTANETGIFGPLPGGTAGDEKRGMCLDSTCFAAKSAAWKKDPDRKRAEREWNEESRRQEAKRQAAFESRIQGGGGGGQAKGKVGRVFPESPAEKLAVAQHAWGNAAVKALIAHVKKKGGDGGPTVALAFVLATANNGCGKHGNNNANPFPRVGRKGPGMEALAAAIGDEATQMPFPPGTAAALLGCIGLWWFAPNYEPGTATSALNVPLPEAGLGILRCLAALARRWAVKVAPMPTAADFPEEAAIRKRVAAREKSDRQGAVGGE